MEKGSIFGLALCLIAVFFSAVLHGISPGFLFKESGSILIVVVGHLGATIAAFPFDVTRNVPSYIGKAMKGEEIPSASDTIGKIVELTSRARAEGILALEDEAKRIDDPFFRKGIELAVDGTDPDALRHTLHSEIAAMKDRHKAGQGWFAQAGTFAPTFGIIGAVFGLMATMAQLSHPQRVGVGIAGAFVATFWGVFLANGIWLPWANKLKQLSTAEVAHKRLIVEGIMAIQAGVSPRVVEELLKSHVPPLEREKQAADAKAANGRGGPAAAAA
jgi:chemotaxis protein MotA